VSPLCAQAGLCLVTGQYSSIVKHFGLQLIEHTIKFNWNVISRPEKIFIKENSMKLLSAGLGGMDERNATHIKDALSRIIVEMIKREWPQQWTTLLAELSEACGKGTVQTEIVLLVFLRLVEDVALLQTIESNQRRKDIYQALTVNMSEIFEFFLRLIELHVSEFRNNTHGQNRLKAVEHSRVVQVVLLTLSGFVEWVSITHIMSGQGRLLQILCILLNDTDFQLPAAECLLQIVNRKGQLKDRKPLMLLFSEEAISYIYRAANQPERYDNEAFYQFLKKLGQVVLGLCAQLTTTWGKEDVPQIQKSNFLTFLETAMLFTRHASLTLSHWGCLSFTTLVRCDAIAKDPAFAEYIPKVIEALGPKIVKVCYPKAARPTKITMHPQTFASIDYDSEEEFLIFFYRCRTDFLEMFRQATLITPLVTFGYCEQWLTVRLQKSAGEVNAACNISDPAYLEWEALTAVLDGVLSRILLVAERPSVASGLRLLEECLKVETRDPLVLSILLSATSSLFVFLSMSSCQLTAANCVAMTGVSLLPRVLDKIFAALVFADPFTNAQPAIGVADPMTCRRKAIKNLRRHAASLMVKIAHKYPLLLLPIFDQINTSVQNLVRQPDQLSYMEQITMQEALLLISNHFCDYERQSNFVGEVIRAGVTGWLGLVHVIKTPATFVEFIGLNKLPGDDMTGLNRRQIMYALNLVLGEFQISIL
jgi:exportin-5